MRSSGALAVALVAMLALGVSADFGALTCTCPAASAAFPGPSFNLLCWEGNNVERAGRSDLVQRRRPTTAQRLPSALDLPPCCRAHVREIQRSLNFIHGLSFDALVNRTC